MGTSSWLERGHLPEPAFYFPVEGGIYQVTAGLKNLGTDFGNGPADGRIIQIDKNFTRYQKNKLECRAERLGKYFATSGFDPEIEVACTRKLISILMEEYPGFFRWRGDGDGTGRLDCAPTSETLTFKNFVLSGVAGTAPIHPPYAGAFDALVNQISEDVAVVRRQQDKDWLAAIHLCAPGHWAAENKIGKTFQATHAPVPHIEPISRAARAMVHAMISKGPFVRFVWGFGSDDRLNHHPDPAPGWDAAKWKGRSFQSVPEGECPFFLRLERQVTVGIPEVDAALFFIRVYYIDGREIRQNPAQRDLLRSSLRTMDAESRQYKGLTESMAPLLEWLG